MSILTSMILYLGGEAVTVGMLILVVSSSGILSTLIAPAILQRIDSRKKIMLGIALIEGAAYFCTTCWLSYRR